VKSERVRHHICPIALDLFQADRLRVVFSKETLSATAFISDVSLPARIKYYRACARTRAMINREIRDIELPLER
jgi:hypothetical protein